VRTSGGGGEVNELDSDAPRMGDSGISSKGDDGGRSVVGEVAATDDNVDSLGECIDEV
jgi:hypothetical protein